MTTYATTALVDLLDAFASNEPLPGGGSAAALTGALGVSLLLMVAGMTKTRGGTPEETADLAEAAARLRPLREDLIALIDADTAAYQSLLAAFRLPKATDAEKDARRLAIAEATRGATEVPLQTMRACAAALQDAPLIAGKGNPNASTDAVVGSQLLLAALRSAGLNVDVNLRGLQDEAFANGAAGERQALEAKASALLRGGIFGPAGGQ